MKRLRYIVRTYPEMSRLPPGCSPYRGSFFCSPPGRDLRWLAIWSQERCLSATERSSD